MSIYRGIIVALLSVIIDSNNNTSAEWQMIALWADFSVQFEYIHTSKMPMAVAGVKKRMNLDLINPCNTNLSQT